MENQKQDTLFDVGMFTTLALVVMGYFAAIPTAFSALNWIVPFVTVPSVLAPLAPAMIVFLLVTIVGFVGTPIFKAASKTYQSKETETDDSSYTYSDAEDEIRDVFETTLDKNENKANITSVDVEDDTLELTFSVNSGREYTDKFIINTDTPWNEDNPIAVLFEYLEAVPPTYYTDLAISDKEVWIRSSRHDNSKFTIDIDKMRNNLPENAFEFDKVDPLSELDREVSHETKNDTEKEAEVVVE